MERFIVRPKNEDYEYGECKGVELCVKLYYRDCFKRLRFTYQPVIWREVSKLINCENKQEVFDYLMKEYQKERNINKAKRMVRRTIKY